MTTRTHAALWLLAAQTLVGCAPTTPPDLAPMLAAATAAPIFDNANTPPQPRHWGLPGDGRVYVLHAEFTGGDRVYARDDRGEPETVPGGWTFYLLTAGGVWLDLLPQARALADMPDGYIWSTPNVPCAPLVPYIELDVAVPFVLDDGSRSWSRRDANNRLVYAEAVRVRIFPPRPIRTDLTGPDGDGVPDGVVNKFDLDYYVARWLAEQGQPQGGN